MLFITFFAALTIAIPALQSYISVALANPKQSYCVGESIVYLVTFIRVETRNVNGSLNFFKTDFSSFSIVRVEPYQYVTTALTNPLYGAYVQTGYFIAQSGMVNLTGTITASVSYDFTFETRVLQGNSSEFSVRNCSLSGYNPGTSNVPYPFLSAVGASSGMGSAVSSARSTGSLATFVALSIVLLLFK